MGWLKIDDGFEKHEKVEQLSNAAHRLWFRAACWCRKQENSVTNGFIPRRVVVDLCGGSTKKVRALARELELAKGEPCFKHEHGLWELRDGGWQFHDWEEYQPTDEDESERREEIRRVKAEAGRAGGKASAEARRTKHGTAQPKQPRSSPEARASKQPEAYASKQTKQPRSPPPPPPPDRIQPVAVESKDLSGSPRGCARGGGGGGSDSRPTNLDQALALPVHDRARAVARDPMLAGYTEPHRWPEVVTVAEALARATGERRPRLGAQRDRGVDAVVALYADGWSQSELVRAVAVAASSEWWRAGRRGLSSLTPEVVRRALADDPPDEEASPALRKALAAAKRSLETNHG